MALMNVNCASRALGASVAFDVILPQEMGGVGVGSGEAAGGKSSTPVLWLLHGATDDHTIWRRRTAIERYAQGLGLAVVMPAVGLSSYTNMAYGADYFTYVADELPELCRAFFPGLSAAREDNYVAGLSMGCYGSLKLALTFPERYAAAAGFSSGNAIAKREIPAFFDTKRRNRNVFGVEDPSSLALSEHDLYALAERAAARAASTGEPLPRIYHACGTEDFAYKASLELKERMEALPGNPFRYEFHQGPGSHSWEFWDEWIQAFLATLPLKKKG
jgi:Predicted esterase